MKIRHITGILLFGIAIVFFLGALVVLARAITAGSMDILMGGVLQIAISIFVGVAGWAIFFRSYRRKPEQPINQDEYLKERARLKAKEDHKKSR